MLTPNEAYLRLRTKIGEHEVLDCCEHEGAYLFTLKPKDPLVINSGTVFAVNKASGAITPFYPQKDFEGYFTARRDRQRAWR